MIHYELDGKKLFLSYPIDSSYHHPEKLVSRYPNAQIFVEQLHSNLFFYTREYKDDEMMMIAVANISDSSVSIIEKAGDRREEEHLYYTGEYNKFCPQSKIHILL